jgi:hypothetical protein
VKSEEENIMKARLNDWLREVQVCALLRDLLGVPDFAAAV